MALGFGVAAITALYLLINLAFLRVVPLSAMQEDPGAVPVIVADAAFGGFGALAINVLMWVSIFGALGGLIMTLPRLCYATAAGYADRSNGIFGRAASAIAYISPRTSVPAGATIFVGVAAIVALLFFGSFSRIVNFVLVPLQVLSILMISTVFTLRRRFATQATFRTPGYPWTPMVYIVVVSVLAGSAIIYNPVDTIIGVALALTAAPVYWLAVLRHA